MKKTHAAIIFGTAILLLAAYQSNLRLVKGVKTALREW
jgi:hypothetical protein